MEIRDEIVNYTDKPVNLTEINRAEILREIGITASKYYDWKRRYCLPR